MKKRRKRNVSAGRNVGGGRRWLIGFLVVVAGSAWVATEGVERYPEYFGPVVVALSAETVRGRVTHVRDGDTIEVRDVAIRLGSLDCAEMNTAAGQRAADRMRSLTTGETLTCHLNGRESYDRKIGSCSLADGTDVAAVLIQEGLCRRFR